MSNEAVLTMTDKPNLAERMHGAVRQLAMDGQTEPLGKLADDLIDLCAQTALSWATVVPIEQLVRVIKRDLRVWDRPTT